MNPTSYTHRVRCPFFISPLAEEDGGGFLISFPDLLGCISDGETQQEAIQNGYDAAKAWLETAKEFNDPIPQPSYLSDGLVNPIPQAIRTKLFAKAKQEGVHMNTLIMAYLAQGLSKQDCASCPLGGKNDERGLNE